ncbi:MAG: 2-amino-4-hydroxy-6-hydroxymethyldihydropteridine diphosphokinase [Selenomonadaceae bacterium]|nr:2-amino-4-hydroxy-6-hydroxymethyldihydropteridine diphosphokinase [Selenomonadaceae bacterium]
MKEAYISLGANLGNREETILQALVMLSEETGVEVTKISDFYETKAWGKSEQPDFINAAAKVLTDKKPKEFLDILLDIEQKLGRKRLEHWGARTIDIDIIDFENMAMDTEKLKLPHPYFNERNFVLKPLLEIASGHIIKGDTIKNYLFNCKDKLSVRKTNVMNFDISMIAAVDAGGGICKKGELLYRLQEDLRFFRRKTIGGVVVVGRKTFEGMGKLVGREIIVLSGSKRFKDKNIETTASVVELFRLLNRFQNKKIFVAGGAEIFKILAPYARKAYITHILDKREADRFMPVLHDFKLKTMRFSEDTGIKLAFATYEKG